MRHKNIRAELDGRRLRWDPHWEGLGSLQRWADVEILSKSQAGTSFKRARLQFGLTLLAMGLSKRSVAQILRVKRESIYSWLKSRRNIEFLNSLRSTSLLRPAYRSKLHPREE